MITADATDAPWGPPAPSDEAEGHDIEPTSAVEAAGDVVEPQAIDRTRWERPALLALLAATAVLYLWGLGASGWANSFYSAAAQAGSTSWKAWFFGSLDGANAITVDKPPASLWVMGLSVRLFGLSSWSILVPQALMGVATVGVVWAVVRRRASAAAALLAGVAMATTPVAALMFRFNNPDALLTLLMAVAAWAAMRGIEDGRRRWVLLVGALIGFGFLTKQLQVLLVVPGLAIAHLVAAPHRLRRRIGDVLLSGAAMVVAAGWWLAAVELTPARLRPYVGGSQHDSILELTLGYNGLGRLNGNETGSVGGGGPANGPGGGPGTMWGATGITRMFDGVMGGQIAWLIPAALVGLGVLLWCSRRAPRTDLVRASAVVWGGWLLVTGLVFSYMQGIFHEYYTVALAPAIAVLVGIGADRLWRRRSSLGATLLLAGTVLATAWWAVRLLDRAPDWNAWLRPLVIVAAVVAVALLVAGRARRRLATAGAVVAAVACLAGPTAWAVQTAATPHTGSIVTAGPAVRGGMGQFGGGGPGGALPGGFPGQGGETGPAFGQNGAMARPNGGQNGGTGGFPMPGGTGGPGGGAGGLLDSAEVGDAVAAALTEDADEVTWVAAAVGANRAAGFQLATEEPVMAIGGFNGSDPSPTLEEFQRYVADGEIHWFIGGGGFGPSMGGSSEAQAIESWVTSNFEATTIDGVTLYDLTS